MSSIDVVHTPVITQTRCWFEGEAVASADILRLPTVTMGARAQELECRDLRICELLVGWKLSNRWEVEIRDRRKKGDGKRMALVEDKSSHIETHVFFCALVYGNLTIMPAVADM